MTASQHKPRLPGEPSVNKPKDRQLSAATRRLYDKWGRYQDSTSEFYTTFKYSRLTGIGKQAGITRRDPTTVLRIDGTYFVWYTRRQTENDRDIRNKPPHQQQTWHTPVYDWDLAEIWYATSQDGFHWQERGVAIRRGPKDAYDGRSVFTPDVLMTKQGYYLYYQAVDYPYCTRTRNSIGMSFASSPHGPWQRVERPVLRPGAAGEWLNDDDSDEVIRYGDWDSHKVHDPFILARDGRYWLYYKGQPMGWTTRYSRGIGWGVAIADQPDGPFVKSPLNPLTNSGHETCLFPYGEGLLAICGHDGPEKDTIQYAADGLNFEVVAHVTLPPPAGGPFAPDSYADTADGSGITWGLAHIATEELKRGNSYLIRFDCNLRPGLERPGFRGTNIRFPESVYFSPDIALNEDNKQPLRYASKPEPPPRAPLLETLSRASQRVYKTFGQYKDQGSEFFSAFKYSSISGLGKELGCTRRDPSKVIRVGEKYFVWYTRRKTAQTWRGTQQASSTRPAWAWDMADIWYAESPDGFHWRECGPAVLRGAPGSFDDRSVFTPDILIHGGKFYLYYQVSQGIWTQRARHLIGMAWAESPYGPWTKLDQPVLQPGLAGEIVGADDDADAIGSFGEWDSHKLHDPFVLRYRGQIWLYYKGVQYGRTYRHDLGIGWGVAMADDPRGPFVKSSLNPITNSGHETFLYPFRKGIVAITSHEGPEKNTVQYASDGLNFQVVGKVSVPPVAAGPYVPDAFTDSQDGRGISWGLSHIHHDDAGPLADSYLVRFDCNLSRDEQRADFYRAWNYRFPESAYFSQGFALTPQMKSEALQLMQAIDTDTIV
ncbi:MAG: family 43 glycosylhydrolase [Chloroflexi bacterium]|nr:family 43 glycosylhydrolase [Chloroflexota bacterium]MCY3583138.1 family 43 glycosylhydrolase [Chloroflexota bacterium]MCY3715357.1 family 43 glycosylhydrolase [Chloroflexota bacterium]MDE2649566.1 family 43 glycosylhydrolase [Chloroflexota bacterium]MYC54229.1 family 43 glycosylhydrolase [Chloroflexota bacterium]